jgi:hypothetical protein
MKEIEVLVRGKKFDFSQKEESLKVTFYAL